MIELVLIIPMVFIGLPHGAADLLVMQKRWGLIPTAIVSVIYFFTFIGGMYLWKWQSDLFLFLLWPASLYHFLDVERQLKKSHFMSFEDIMFFSLLTLPVLKFQDFSSYLQILNGDFFAEIFISGKFVIFTVQIGLSAWCIWKSFLNRNIILHLGLYALVTVLVWHTNLLISFACLFLFVHSLRHLKLSFAKNLISKDSYLFILLPISVVSILCIYLFQTQATEIQQNSVFLMVGLGALAFPHLVIEHFVSK